MDCYLGTLHVKSLEASRHASEHSFELRIYIQMDCYLGTLHVKSLEAFRHASVSHRAFFETDSMQ